MIRPFSPSDLYSILKIEQKSFPKSPYDSRTFLQLYAFCPETFLVYVGTDVDQEEQIWGYIIFLPEGRVISIAVLPTQRRKGIGRELIQKAMEISHIKRLQVEVRKSNVGAQAFYARLGFRRYSMIPNYYGDEDGLLLEWVSQA